MNYRSSEQADHHYWPPSIKRVFYRVPLRHIHDETTSTDNLADIDKLNIQSLKNDERAYMRSYINKEGKYDPQNLSALYSKGSAEGWLYAQLPICKEDFRFYPPMKLVQGSFDWIIENIEPWYTEPTTLETIELDILYEKCSPICMYKRQIQCDKEGRNKLHCNACSEHNCDCSKLDDRIARDFLGKPMQNISNTEMLDLYESRFGNEMSNGDNTLYDSYIRYFSVEYHEGKPPVLVYFCPSTLMMEVVSPLAVDGLIIGVLITGQVIKEETIGAVLLKCREWLDETLQQLIDGEKPEDISDIYKELIMKEDSQLFNEYNLSSCGIEQLRGIAEHVLNSNTISNFINHFHALTKQFANLNINIFN